MAPTSFYWWGKETHRGTPVVVKMENPNNWSMVELESPTENDFLHKDRGRNKNAKQLTWVLLLKAHRAAGCLTSIASATVSIVSASVAVYPPATPTWLQPSAIRRFAKGDWNEYVEGNQILKIIFRFRERGERTHKLLLAYIWAFVLLPAFTASASAYSKVNETACLHCGFYSEAGGFTISNKDKTFMQTCKSVVSICTIGGGDDLYQPVGMSDIFTQKGRLCSFMQVCYVAFWDETTLTTQEAQGHVSNADGFIGKWHIVIVINLPFRDQRLNGKIPMALETGVTGR